MDRICTIVASNYLAQAKVLVESIRRIYPENEVYVLVIDGIPEDSQHIEKAKLVLPEDLDMPDGWLREMRSYYDAMELATSLKPFLLRWLLNDQISTVSYLDPDILLFSEIKEGIDAARKYGIALTPHRLTPGSNLSLEKTELNFLKSGVFNLGYISVSTKSLPMLNWWGERLHFYCTKFPGYDVFTDQKWMNLIPSFFEHSVIKNKGYNLASWNLDERTLQNVEGKIHAGNDLLVFIHFAQMSGKLSKGIETKNWRDSIFDFDQKSMESLRIIEDITRNYSKDLVSQRSLINSSISKDARLKISDLSYHKKRKIIDITINQSLNLLETQEPISDSNKVFKSNRIMLILERSSALNGLRDGLKSDINRLISKRKKRL
jgi:hypothetical protein